MTAGTSGTPTEVQEAQCEQQDYISVEKLRHDHASRQPGKHAAQVSLHPQGLEILRDAAPNHFCGLDVGIAAGSITHLQFTYPTPIERGIKVRPDLESRIVIVNRTEPVAGLQIDKATAIQRCGVVGP